MTTQPLRFGTTGATGCWVGVIRRGRTVLATCGHTHSNRAMGNAPAAACIQRLVNEARHGLSDLERGRAVAHAARARSLGARYADTEALAKAESTLAAIAASGALTEPVLGSDGKPVRHFDGQRMVETFPRVA